ncbi:MAG: type II toxin-antitoxin system ParD family antitoxin [Sphingomonas sp.]|jgi:antitoxin ParD1/3/4
MAQAQPVTVSLPPEMAAMMRQKVEEGEYSSVSEVVREALRDWSRKQSAEQRELQELRALLQEAVDSGPGEGGETVFARLRARYSE